MLITVDPLFASAIFLETANLNMANMKTNILWGEKRAQFQQPHFTAFFLYRIYFARVHWFVRSINKKLSMVKKDCTICKHEKPQWRISSWNETDLYTIYWQCTKLHMYVCIVYVVTHYSPCGWKHKSVQKVNLNKRAKHFKIQLHIKLACVWCIAVPTSMLHDRWIEAPAWPVNLMPL